MKSAQHFIADLCCIFSISMNMFFMFHILYKKSIFYFHVSYIVQEEYLLLQEEDFLLVQEEDLLLAEEDILLAEEEDILLAEDDLLLAEEDILLVNEEDILLVHEEDILLVQYMKHENNNCFLLQYIYIYISMTHENKYVKHENIFVQ